jgi:hypothetical protein
MRIEHPPLFETIPTSLKFKFPGATTEVVCSLPSALAVSKSYFFSTNSTFF